MDLLVGAQEKEFLSVLLEACEADGGAGLEVCDLFAVEVVDEGFVAAIFYAEEPGLTVDADHIPEDLLRERSCLCGEEENAVVRGAQGC